MAAPKEFMTRMMTNRKGRPITVWLAGSEKPNAAEYDGVYVDPVDGAKVEIELDSVWTKSSGSPPPDAYEVKLKKR